MTTIWERDKLLCLSFILACIGCAANGLNFRIFENIDINTLMMLFCLMLAVEGLKESRVFFYVSERLLNRTRSERSIFFVLVGLCFISSMFITNDVALLTFVPLGLLMMEEIGYVHKIPVVMVLMTLAANLGSMLTPFGNPQNLYLYDVSGLHFDEFIKLMLPSSTIAAVLLIIFVMFNSQSDFIDYASKQCISVKRIDMVYYGIIFLLCILAVLRIVPKPILLCVVIGMVIVFNYKLLFQIDYGLLLTFICLFIFIGSVEQIPSFSHFLRTILAQHASWSGILLSQFISNVPAALLLSNYVADMRLLIVSTNLGGLGTLIASMASVISYKILAKYYPEKRRQYMLLFTAYNVIFLFFLCWFQ